MMERNLKSQLLCFNPAILKDSGFNEIDRAECQFFTTATILDNGSQVWGQFMYLATGRFSTHANKISMNNFLCEGVKGFETDCRKIRKEYRKRVLSM